MKAVLLLIGALFSLVASPDDPDQVNWGQHHEQQKEARQTEEFARSLPSRGVSATIRGRFGEKFRTGLQLTVANPKAALENQNSPGLSSVVEHNLGIVGSGVRIPRIQSCSPSEAKQDCRA